MQIYAEVVVAPDLERMSRAISSALPRYSNGISTCPFSMRVHHQERERRQNAQKSRVGVSMTIVHTASERAGGRILDPACICHRG
jgi:hypothetical protein